MQELIKLNICCGDNKIPGFLGLDIEASFEPDIIHDIRRPIPLRPESVDEVVMFHAIEHIEKLYHIAIFSNIWTVLKPDAPFLISFPEFTKCVENWKTNYHGKKDFWEATIYGAQRTKGDYHVAIMHTPDVKLALVNSGFEIEKVCEEPDEPFNTVIKCRKGQLVTYEDALLTNVR